jgi:NitT/TauT family transport system permease protein
LGIAKEIILPAPEQVLLSFFKLFGSQKFLGSLVVTTVRVAVAFLLSMALGSIAGFFSGISPRFSRLIFPLMAVIKATPVVAIILIAWIWFPFGFVPVFSAILMAFPVVLADIAAGVRSVDKNLVSMAQSFGSSRSDILWIVRVPAALPHILAAARNSLGLAWKVVVSGEVLSQPAFAIGTGMQAARQNLETVEVFAWVAAVIVLCAISDFIFTMVARILPWNSA